MSVGKRRPCVFLALIFSLLFLAQLPAVQAHAKQVQNNGEYEITYFSTPQDPIVNSPTTLFIQVRNVASGLQLNVLHFVVRFVPPGGTGPQPVKHPFSNSTEFTFSQPGDWFLLFTIGLRNLAEFDTTAAFVADVSTGAPAGLLAAFVNVLAVEFPRVYPRWGHIFAVVLWLGMMLHVVNVYRQSLPEPAGINRFARTYKKADVIVALAVGLLISTGVFRAVFVHGISTASLFGSDFGLVLFAKIALAAGMVVIGLINRVILLRRLERSMVPNGTGAGSSLLVETGISRRIASRIYSLTLFEIALGASAILFGTIFAQIHTIA